MYISKNLFNVRAAKAAADFGCPNDACGCNDIPAQRLFTNYFRAIKFWEQVLDSTPEGVKVSVFNCRNDGGWAPPQGWIRPAGPHF